MPAPWFGSRKGKAARIVVHRSGEEPRDVLVESYAGLYTIEADTVAANIEKRQAPHPAVTWDDTLGNMRTLDMWRAAMGQVYDIERPDAQFPTVDRRPLTVRGDSNMKHGSLDGIEKPVSRLVMGTTGGAWLPFASVMFDEFFRCGGNCFDTAHVYGRADSILGQWIMNRGIREQVIILAKGAHTPHCNPDGLTAQLMESLDHLQTDYVDIYMMHRDNPEIPVGEFIDVLNEHKKAGRIRAFGGSNWTIERIEAANEYAKSKGLTGFAAVNNNLSLARMIEAPWDGCLASSDPESRAWFERTQAPLMAWSSLGRGFFVRGDEDDLSDQVLVRCWYSEDNFQRLERAKELATKKGVLPVQIALAYVLSASRSRPSRSSARQTCRRCASRLMRWTSSSRQTSWRG